MTGDHHLRLRHGFGVGGTMEAIAFLTDGFVEADHVSSSAFLFFVEADDAGVRITARVRHPTAEEPVRVLLAPLLAVVAGLYKAGANVEASGLLAHLLPSGGRLEHEQGSRPALTLRQIFEDHLAPHLRTLPIEPDVLEEVFTLLRTRTDKAGWLAGRHGGAVFPRVSTDRDGTLILGHAAGFEMAALLTDGVITSHCFTGRRGPGARARMNWFHLEPRVARTWGEVWANHSFGGRRAQPEGLEILPDEVMLVQNHEISRYAIADRSSLERLGSFDFGPGKSPIYSAQVWLGIGEQFGETQLFGVARACAEQALLVAADDADLAHAREDVVRWGEWEAFARTPKVPAEPVRRLPVRPLAKLLKKLDANCAPLLAEHAAGMKMQREEDAYWPRPYQPMRGAADWQAGFNAVYEGVTGHRLIAAGLTPAQGAALGVGFPIPPPQRYPDIFTIRCGKAVILGTMTSGVLVLTGDDKAVYDLA